MAAFARSGRVMWPKGSTGLGGALWGLRVPIAFLHLHRGLLHLAALNLAVVCERPRKSRHRIQLALNPLERCQDLAKDFGDLVIWFGQFNLLSLPSAP